MSRSGYSYGSEGVNLWRGAVDRAIYGKRGQAFLIELAAALDVMPKKELIREALVTQAGECCTIGVICKSRSIPTHNIDPDDPVVVGAAVGIARAMAAEIEFLNDEADAAEFETPKQRWVRMREWVKDHIKEINVST